MNPVNFSKSSVATAVTTDIVSSINKGTQKISAFHSVFNRGNPRIVIALDQLECTITFKMPDTNRFKELVGEILSISTSDALEVLADVALGIRKGYNKLERICASQIHSAINN